MVSRSPRISAAPPTKGALSPGSPGPGNVAQPLLLLTQGAPSPDPASPVPSRDPGAQASPRDRARVVFDKERAQRNLGSQVPPESSCPGRDSPRGCGCGVKGSRKVYDPLTVCARQAQTPQASCSSFHSTWVDGPESLLPPSSPVVLAGAIWTPEGTAAPACGLRSFHPEQPPALSTPPTPTPPPCPQRRGRPRTWGLRGFAHSQLPWKAHQLPWRKGDTEIHYSAKFTHGFQARSTMGKINGSLKNKKMRWETLPGPCRGRVQVPRRQALVYRSGNFQGPGTGPDRTRLGSRLGMDQAV